MNKYKNLEDLINFILLKKNIKEKINYQDNSYKIFPILIREYYSLLSKDKAMNNLVNNKKNFFLVNNWIVEDFLIKKKIFYIKWFKYYLNKFLNSTELPFFFYFFFKNFFIKNKKLDAEIICLVRERKHYKYLKKIFKNKTLKIKFLVISNEHKKKIKSHNFETIYLENIDFNKLSLFCFNFSKYKFFIKILFNTLKKIKPKILLTVEGDEWLAELTTQVANNLKIKTICVQWGCYPFKNPRSSLYFNSSNYFLSWGNFFSKQLGRYNKSTKFLNFGYPADKKNFKKNDVIIIFGFNPSEIFKEKNLNDLYNLAFKLAKQLPNYKVYFRNHPSIKNINYSEKDLFKKKLPNLSLDTNSQPYELLSKSKICIGCYSSLLTESIYYDTVPIAYNFNENMSYYPSFKKYKIGFEATNIDDLEKYIINLSTKENLYKELIKGIIKQKKTFFDTKKNINRNLKYLIKKTNDN